MSNDLETVDDRQKRVDQFYEGVAKRREKQIRACRNYYDPADPLPVSLPVGIGRPPTLHEQIERLRRDPAAMSQTARMLAMEDLVESDDELDDFDPKDDDRLVSPHEIAALEADAREARRVVKKRKSFFKSFEEREGLPDATTPPAEPNDPVGS